MAMGTGDAHTIALSLSRVALTALAPNPQRHRSARAEKWLPWTTTRVALLVGPEAGTRAETRGSKKSKVDACVWLYCCPLSVTCRMCAPPPSLDPMALSGGEEQSIALPFGSPSTTASMPSPKAHRWSHPDPVPCSTRTSVAPMIGPERGTRAVTTGAVYVANWLPLRVKSCALSETSNEAAPVGW